MLRLNAIYNVVPCQWKTTLRRLGVHNKTHYKMDIVRLLSLSKIIGRPVRVTLFCENTPIIWDQHKLKGAFKLSVFTPKVYTPKSLFGSLPPDSDPTPKTIFTYRHCSWIIQYSRPHTRVLNTFNTIALQFNIGS